MCAGEAVTLTESVIINLEETLPQKGISIVKALEDLNQHKMLQFSLKYIKKSIAQKIQRLMRQR